MMRDISVMLVLEENVSMDVAIALGENNKKILVGRQVSRIL